MYTVFLHSRKIGQWEKQGYGKTTHFHALQWPRRWKIKSRLKVRWIKQWSAHLGSYFFLFQLGLRCLDFPNKANHTRVTQVHIYLQHLGQEPDNRICITIQGLRFNISGYTVFLFKSNLRKRYKAYNILDIIFARERQGLNPTQNKPLSTMNLQSIKNSDLEHQHSSEMYLCICLLF